MISQSDLAYYAAIWRTVQGRSGTYDVPVVVDSPNQQAQDDLKLPAVLSFSAENLPTGLQLIVGLETPTNFSCDREVTLTEKYRMLIERDWETTLELVTPLLKKMYDATLAQSQS